MPEITRTYIICDRCKKEYERTPNTPTTMWMSFQSFNHSSNDPASFGFDFGHGNKKYYLCQECEEEFVNWFLQRSKEKLRGKSADTNGDEVDVRYFADSSYCRFEHGKFVDGCKIR